MGAVTKVTALLLKKLIKKQPNNNIFWYNRGSIYER